VDDAGVSVKVIFIFSTQGGRPVSSYAKISCQTSGELVKL